MNMSLTPQIEAMVREKIESGLYSDADAVLLEALRVLEHRDQIRRLRASLDEAEAAIARGEYTLWGPTTMAEIMLEAAVDEPRGRPLDPDVFPRVCRAGQPDLDQSARSS